MDYKYWKFIWSLVACFAIIGVMCITTCTMHIDYRIAKAIQNGTDPVKARYAFGDRRYTDLAIIRLSDRKE
jgi:hypothetical protein